uniref:Cobalamin adenosyltransferase-like domain-containing protein n=1 Tax=Salmo trutta TaxID=8032 RepID=A0A674A2F8_SALTR
MITITKTSQLRCILTTVTCLTVNRTKTSFGSKLSTKLDSSIPKICTKTGDKGFSNTYTGERRPKEDHVFEALGTTDEMSLIQCVLQDVGSNIATPWSSKSKLSSQPVADLESCLNAFTEELPPLTNFILPNAAARLVFNLPKFSHVTPLLRSLHWLPLINFHLTSSHRLSDYLFTVARYTAMKEGNEEKIYKRPE